jgi:hypothetical protein
MNVSQYGVAASVASVLSSCASAEPIRVPPTMADRMSAPAKPSALVSHIE